MQFIPKDIKISPHVLEFVRRNANFSDLKIKEKSEETWMKINENQLSKLKEKIKKEVLCQSYLLHGNQYEVLCGEKRDIFSDIERTFQVKGYPYQLPMVGDIPVIFQLNQLTKISCVMSSEPENIPLDCLISVACKKPQSDFNIIEKKEKYKILENDSWNHTMNRHITLLMPDITERKSTYPWNDLFEMCLNEVSKNDIFPHTIGISIPTEIPEYLMCQGIVTAVSNLSQIYKRSIYILLFVEAYGKLTEVIEILKNIPVANFESEEIPSSSEAEECIVDVIEGLITDQKVDVIVGSSNRDIDLKEGAVAAAILQKAGSELQKECYERYPRGISFPEIAITKGCNLPCESVFFSSLPSYVSQPHIYTFVESCLLKAVEHNYSSIAFPALGTGRLGYPSHEVATQMASAIAQFKKNPKNSLKKIIIVIYPDSKNMEPLFELKNMFAKDKDSKGAIQKRKPNSLQQNQQRHAQNWTRDQLEWVQFFDYSNKKDTLDHAIEALEKCLLNSPRGLKRNFQFNQNIQESMDFVGATNIESFPFDQGRINAQSGPSASSFKAAKNNENTSSLSDQFNSNNPKSSEFDEQNMRSTYYPKFERTRTFVSNFRENNDIYCFKTEDGFLVKIYEENILNVNVDGIVNAANKWLSHGGGLAGAIIKAAGDIVNREGQAKRQNRELNAGEVLSTSAGNLKHYKCIIHAIGPNYSTLQPADDYYRRKITETVFNTLELANKLGLVSIAVPAISSGIFGVPLHICTEGYFLGVEEFYKKKPPNCQLMEVHFVDMNSKTCKNIRDYFTKQLNETTTDIAINNNQQPNYTSPDISIQENSENDDGDDPDDTSKEPMEHSDIVSGNQPNGIMEIDKKIVFVLGCSSSTEIYEIKYTLSNSHQWNQPIIKNAYVPATDEGETILKMLQLAFEQRLIFKDNKGHVQWADIPHKTSLYGELEKDGSLSPSYWNKVKDCLAKKGITPELVAGRGLQLQIITE